MFYYQDLKDIIYLPLKEVVWVGCCVFKDILYALRGSETNHILPIIPYKNNV